MKVRSIRRRRRTARRTRRNPPHSAAMRRKIGLAVKRAMSKRRAGGGTTRRRRSGRVRTRTIVRTRTRRIAVAAPRRRRRSAGGGIRRAVRRIGARRRNAGGGKLSLGSIFSKENLGIAGGVVGSTIITRFVLGKFGNMLPGASSPIGQAAYSLGISFAAATVLKKVSPGFRNVADGILIGGLVQVVNSVMTMALPKAAVAEYLGGYDPVMSLGPATQQLANTVAPAPRVDAYLESMPAFEDSAW